MPAAVAIGNSADALDQLLAPLAIGDQVGDRHLLQAVARGEGRDLGAAHDGAVVVDEFGEHADRRQLRQAAEVDRGLGVAGAHQHAALAGDQREDVARADEIVGAGVRIGERADGQLQRSSAEMPVVSAVAEIDRDGEGGAERRIVVGDHRVEVQAARLGPRQRRADDAAWCGGR